MFAIGDKEWPGISKLIEETGELQQVLGKLMGSKGDPNHWSGDLNAKLIEEMGDVFAALAFVMETNGLDDEAIMKQADMKLERFEKWHKEIICPPEK